MCALMGYEGVIVHINKLKKVRIKGRGWRCNVLITITSSIKINKNYNKFIHTELPVGIIYSWELISSHFRPEEYDLLIESPYIITSIHNQCMVISGPCMYIYLICHIEFHLCDILLYQKYSFFCMSHITQVEFYVTCSWVMKWWLMVKWWMEVMMWDRCPL